MMSLCVASWHPLTLVNQSQVGRPGKPHSGTGSKMGMKWGSDRQLRTHTHTHTHTHTCTHTHIQTHTYIHVGVSGGAWLRAPQTTAC
jgi:hypothetical protein